MLKEIDGIVISEQDYKESSKIIKIMTRDGQVKELSKDELELGYRRSIITKTADIVLEEKELVKTLTTSYYFHALQKPDNLLQKAPQGWFPLPFFLTEADAF